MADSSPSCETGKCLLMDSLEKSTHGLRTAYVGYLDMLDTLGCSVNLAEENLATGGANFVQAVLVVVANDFG